MSLDDEVSLLEVNPDQPTEVIAVYGMPIPPGSLAILRPVQRNMPLSVGRYFTAMLKNTERYRQECSSNK